MRFLEGAELEFAHEILNYAADVARKSPCEKSKRGVVIVKGREMIGEGFNGPPLGFTCEPEKCKSICNAYCVHAEENAIMDALKKGNDIMNATMYHIKVKDGKVNTSGDPCCPRCSALALQVGTLEFVLSHDQGVGLYPMDEFHRLSLINSVRK